MDIRAPRGSRVRFAHPDNGYMPHQDLACRHLTAGEIYTVRWVAVGAFCSSVYLEEVPGIAFNTVMFDDVYIVDERDRVC